MKRDTDKFHLMKVFHMVATKGSFTDGAKELGMTVSSVSKAVQQLESNLRTKLLYRTTRSQSLTDSGKIYLAQARLILADIKALEEQLLQQAQHPSGTLRVTAPIAIGQFFLSPKIHEFMRLYPQIRIELFLSDRVVDVTEEGFDLAIRSRNVPEISPLFCKKLGSHSRKLVAAPDYLAGVELPKTPARLPDLKLLNYSGSQALAAWSFSHAGQEIAFEPEAALSCNNYYALLQAACSGCGVANLYQYLVDEKIEEGTLIHLLPEWKQSGRELYAIYHQRRDISPKLDKFISFLSRSIT